MNSAGVKDLTKRHGSSSDCLKPSEDLRDTAETI